MGDGGLDGVEGAEGVDIYDGLEGVRAHGVEGSDEVASGAGTVPC